MLNERFTPFFEPLLPQKKREFPFRPSRSKIVFFYPIILTTCILLFSSGQAGATARVGATPLYSCGNPYSGHCYGVNDWYGDVTGSSVYIFTNQMHAGNEFVNNEMWLTQGSSYWVEIGLTAALDVNSGNESLFWADSRPNGGGYTNHYGAQLTKSDFSKYGFFEIVQDSSSTFSVEALGLPVATISGKSTANPIVPNNIEIGMEVAGSSGVTAPLNGFTGNQYSNSNGWFYQPIEGSIISNGGIYAHWKYPPARDGSNYGGEFDTCFNSSCP